MSGRFEIPDELRVLYRYDYGAISPFFASLPDFGGTFTVTRCPSCGLTCCPPRSRCSECWAETTWVDHAGAGVLESLVWAYWIPYDSPAREWVDLPYAYGAVRLAGCANLLRTRVTGLDPSVELPAAFGRRGRLRVLAVATGRLGDLYFEVAAADDPLRAMTSIDERS